MPALSSLRTAAVGGLCSVLFWELCHHTGGRRRPPNYSLDWLSSQTPHAIRYSGGVWSCRLPDGRTLYSRNKSTLEQALDNHDQQGKGGAR